MNIFEVAHKTGISLKSLRKLEKLKLDFGALDDEPDTYLHAAKIRFMLMRKGTLTVEQLLQLIDDRDIFDELKKYRAAAQTQVDALGDFKATAAPIEVQGAIDSAAGGDVIAAREIATWLRRILPAAPVSHAWVAVRLIVPLIPLHRETMAPRVSLALMHTRRLPEFAGYWESVKDANDRNSIKYFQKRNFPLDL